MALTYDSRAAAGTLIQSYVRIKEARQNDTPGLPTLVATFKGVCQGVGAAIGMNSEVLRNITKAYVDSDARAYSEARTDSILSDEKWNAYCDGLAEKLEKW